MSEHTYPYHSGYMAGCPECAKERMRKQQAEIERLQAQRNELRRLVDEVLAYDVVALEDAEWIASAREAIADA